MEEKNCEYKIKYFENQKKDFCIYEGYCTKKTIFPAYDGEEFLICDPTGEHVKNIETKILKVEFGKVENI